MTQPITRTLQIPKTKASPTTKARTKPKNNNKDNYIHINNVKSKPKNKNTDNNDNNKKELTDHQQQPDH